MTPDEETRLANVLLRTLQDVRQNTTNAAAHARSVASLALNIIHSVERLHPSYHPNPNAVVWRNVNPAYPHISSLPWRAAQAVYLFVCTDTQPDFQMALEFNFQDFERILSMTHAFMQSLVEKYQPISKSVDEQAKKIAQRLSLCTGAYALKKLTVQDAVIQLAGICSERNDNPDVVQVYDRDASSVVLARNDRRIKVTFVLEGSS